MLVLPPRCEQASPAMLNEEISVQSVSMQEASDEGGFEASLSPAEIIPVQGHFTRREKQVIALNHFRAVSIVDPKFLRNMRFAKKHNKKGLKKMRANNAK
ncbi:NF-kappa-B inhibitor delta [Platysternon megacephalum]|uniref:Large ribosomal subunit protein eL29 n=1 Tax=Platysternon megacephalum TaxID=55544 RepID=A0A4D9E062_9SAUR|nr:NF-kappa-B inhibitor delta [Platysternon megacephalum]